MVTHFFETIFNASNSSFVTLYSCKLMLLQTKDLVSPRVIVVKNFQILKSLFSLFCFDSEAQELNVLKLIFTYINRKSCSQKLKGCIIDNVSILECRMYLHQTHQTEIWFLHLCRAINLHRANLKRTTFLSSLWKVVVDLHFGVQIPWVSWWIEVKIK